MQEVKELANTLIAYVPCVLMYVPGPGSPENARLFGPAIDLLTRKTLAAKLHWREAAVAELLFAHVAPCMQDAGALEQIVTAQAHDLLSGSTLIAKVRRTPLRRQAHCVDAFQIAQVRGRCLTPCRNVCRRWALLRC